jgi:hypothetical protein
LEEATRSSNLAAARQIWHPLAGSVRCSPDLLVGHCKRERQEGGLARAKVEEERRIAHPTPVEECCHLIRACRI